MSWTASINIFDSIFKFIGYPLGESIKGKLRKRPKIGRERKHHRSAEIDKRRMGQW